MTARGRQQRAGAHRRHRYDQEQAKDGKPVPTSVVTLLVTPEDAERIALAANQGSIMLTLRNPLDTSPTVTKGADGLADGRARPAARDASRPGRPPRGSPKPVAPPPAPKIYSVETIRAAKRAEEVVK